MVFYHTVEAKLENTVRRIPLQYATAREMIRVPQYQHFEEGSCRGSSAHLRASGASPRSFL